MIFNPWRKFPRWKPKKDDYYLCTIYSLEANITYATRLYYERGKWLNNDRRSVFKGYNVYKPCRATIEENHVYSDSLCDRTDDVIYWKKMPKGKEAKKYGRKHKIDD